MTVNGNPSRRFVVVFNRLQSTQQGFSNFILYQFITRCYCIHSRTQEELFLLLESIDAGGDLLESCVCLQSKEQCVTHTNKQLGIITS